MPVAARHIVRSLLVAVAALVAVVFAVTCRADDHGIGPATTAPGSAPITAETLTDGHVRAAIDAIVTEIYARKDPRHFWDPAQWDTSRHGSKYQTGGYTALTVLALLYAGESYQDPRLRDAVDRLTKAELRGTYAVTVRTGVWAKLPPRFAPNLEADTSWLLDGFSPDVAGWAYQQRPRTQRRDNSLRQFGALALWESAKRGGEIPESIWRRLEDVFIEGQLPDGGWNYRGDRDPPTGSMTAAGLATLFITQDLLHAERAVSLAKGPDARSGDAIERGLAWMNEHFTPEENPGSFRDFYYYLYAVERAGLASGVKAFGGRDWYRTGAVEIIRRLCAWDPVAGTMTVHDKVGGARGASIRIRHLDFALMFLSRGRVPVAVNKLLIADHPSDNRSRDAANVARWLSDATEGEVSWQRVDANSAPETWLDAPLLYLASNRALPWARAQPDQPDGGRDDDPRILRLKRYLDLGGLLIAVDEGRRKAFAASIEQLGSVMYPAYEWRTLENDHWAYTIHAPVTGRRPTLRALSNGVRELIVVAPSQDLAAAFQRGPSSADRRSGLREFTTISNLYFYASEMNRPRPRVAVHAYAGAAPPTTPRTVIVVRAIHGGNWNPEPAALEVFGNYLAAEHGLTVDVIARPLDTVDEIEPLPSLVHITGTGHAAFTAAEREAVATYANAGGVVLFETAGGTGPFTQEAEAMASTLFGAPIRSLLRDPVISGTNIPGAANLFRLEYRPYSFEFLESRETTPRLRGITIDGAPRVLFSREDLSHGLLDQPRWGINGYAPDSARALMTNIVLHALRPAESE